MMKHIRKIMLFIGIMLLCFVMIGCDDDDDPASPSSPIDLSGTYSLEGEMTPVSGNCDGVLTSNSGTATVAQDSDGNITVEACEFAMGPCTPGIFTGKVEDQQVTMQVDVAVSELTILLFMPKEQQDQLFPDGEIDPIEVHVSVSGPVTDTSRFTLSGQGTKEEGACVLDATVTLTKM